MTNKNIYNVSNIIVSNTLIMGGDLSNLIQIENLSIDKFRHREVVY